MSPLLNSSTCEHEEIPNLKPIEKYDAKYLKGVYLKFKVSHIYIEYLFFINIKILKGNA